MSKRKEAEAERAKEEQAKKEAAEREAQLLKRMLMEEADEHYIQGVRLQREKRYREAMASYQRAFESSPEHVGALFNYALLLEREHRTAQARQFYDRCVELTKAQSAAKLLHQRLATFASKT